MDLDKYQYNIDMDMQYKSHSFFHKVKKYIYLNCSSNLFFIIILNMVSSFLFLSSKWRGNVPYINIYVKKFTIFFSSKCLLHCLMNYSWATPANLAVLKTHTVSISILNVEGAFCNSVIISLCWAEGYQ